MHDLKVIAYNSNIFSTFFFLRKYFCSLNLAIQSSATSLVYTMSFVGAWIFPFLMLLWTKINYFTMNGLHLFIFRWNHTQTIFYFIALHRYIFTVDAVNETEKEEEENFKFISGCRASNCGDKLHSKENTYSEMWTNKSSPPECGVINPWPFPRLKLFTIPVSIGFANALADLQMKNSKWLQKIFFY